MFFHFQQSRKQAGVLRLRKDYSVLSILARRKFFTMGKKGFVDHRIDYAT
jgi:hypothetical protein